MEKSFKEQKLYVRDRTCYIIVTTVSHNKDRYISTRKWWLEIFFTKVTNCQIVKNGIIGKYVLDNTRILIIDDAE